MRDVFLAGRATPLPSVNRGEASDSGPPTRAWQAFAGWLVAAGALFYIFTGGAVPTSSGAGWEELSARTTPVAWQATGDVAVGEAGGGVVWDQNGQVGWMRISGLRANDPNQSQYQLWIFDGERPDATPVDGGVFDVTSDGEVLVPIEAKLEVFDPTLFAVTVEEPGGSWSPGGSGSC